MPFNNTDQSLITPTTASELLVTPVVLDASRDSTKRTHASLGDGCGYLPLETFLKKSNLKECNTFMIAFRRSAIVSSPWMNNYGTGIPSIWEFVITSLDSQYYLKLPVSYGDAKGSRGAFRLEIIEWMKNSLGMTHVILMEQNDMWNIRSLDCPTINGKIKDRLTYLNNRNRSKILHPKWHPKWEQTGVDHMTLLPWNSDVLKISRPLPIKASSRNSGFGGRFSWISSLGSEFNVGVINCSHTQVGDDNGSYHVGGISRVKVPNGCFILFHSGLYHYGDRCRIVGGQYIHDMRAFSYLVESEYVMPSTTETFPLSDKIVCDEKDCAECFRMKCILKEVTDDFGVVVPLPETMMYMHPGKMLSGNLALLGWAVVKGLTPNKENQLLMEEELVNMNNVVTWSDIGNQNIGDTNGTMNKTMKVKSLCDPTISQMRKRHKKVKCSRQMLYAKGVPEKKFREKYPCLHTFFDNSLLLAKLFLHRDIGMFKQYKFSGKNILRNIGYVNEQYIHTDYPYISRNKSVTQYIKN